jgi:hypothetical protein
MAACSRVHELEKAWLKPGKAGRRSFQLGVRNFAGPPTVISHFSELGTGVNLPVPKISFPK